MKVLTYLFLSFLTLCVTAQCDRQIAVDDYNNTYLATNFNVADMNWTGDFASCNPGTISQSVQDKIIDRINYFRRMCDLDDNTVLLPSLNTAAQESALMQEAEGSLSHCTGVNGAPCDTWACTSPGGITASQQGNLAYGTWNFFNPITIFMEDSGAGNEAVGHRRWILYTGAEEFGNGMTPNRETLFVINNFGNPPNNNKPFVAYPPDGYIPAPLVFPRWSFGMRGATFTNASVTMTDQNGNDVPLNIIYNASVNFGDLSVVWEPTGIDTSNPEDVVYTVTVSGIVGAPQSSYTYDTKIIQPIHPPACASGTMWDEASCACVSPIADCDPNLIINDNPIASGTYQAEMTITSEGEVPSGNDVTFKAGDQIELLPEFEAKEGSEFLASIEDCTPTTLSLSDNTNLTKKANTETEKKEGQFVMLGEAVAVRTSSPSLKKKRTLFKRAKQKRTRGTICPRF